MSDPVVMVRGLRKEYGNTVALANLDLEIPRGARFGLLGPNGAGKSTTFGILCGWLRATAGSATVLGTPTPELHQLRGRVTALPQDAYLPDHVPLLEQLTHYRRLSGAPADQARADARGALEAVGLGDSLQRRGHELSHGMHKRAGLAQALLCDPEVMFLDEPTAGLDPKSARQIKDLIARQPPQTTVVLSSHNLSDVQELCTHGAILDRGQLVTAGMMETLTRRGAEVTIETRPDAALPWDALRNAFGPDGAQQPQPHILRIVFPTDADPATVIGQALQILLNHHVPVLGVQRGTSLERAFMQLTASS